MHSDAFFRRDTVSMKKCMTYAVGEEAFQLILDGEDDETRMYSESVVDRVRRRQVVTTWSDTYACHLIDDDTPRPFAIRDHPVSMVG